MAKKRIITPSQGGHAYSLERDLSKPADLPGPRKATSRSVEYSDVAVEGLRLTLNRAGGAGTGSWSWRYVVLVDGKREYRRLPLGRYPTVTYDQAAAALKQAKADRHAGDDPHKAQEKREKEKSARLTFAEHVAGPVTDYFAKKKRPHEPVQLLTKNAVPVIGHIPVMDLTTKHIEELLEGILHDQLAKGKKGTLANAVRAALSSAMRLVKKRTLVRDCEFAEPLPHGQPKEIFIDQPDQARRMLDDAGRLMPEPFGDMLRLQLLTGARPIEIAHLRRFNYRANYVVPHAHDMRATPGKPRTRTLPVLHWSTTKNGKAHLVPLSRQALAIVERRLAVSGPEADAPLFCSTKPGSPLNPTRLANEFQAVRDSGALDVPEGFAPHCARKTAATILEVLGYGSHIPALVLNHRAQTITGRHYALYNHLSEIADALQTLADCVAPDDTTERGNSAPADILPFPQGARL